MKQPYAKPTLLRRGLLSPITATPPTSGVIISDIRLKEDIQRVGTTALGLPLYRFRYRGQEGAFEGVMAQDVLLVAPEAVSVGPDGYLRVDYVRLGAPFRRVN